jgi:hypothetical protein
VDRDLVGVSGDRHDHDEQVRRGVLPGAEPAVWAFRISILATAVRLALVEAVR